MSGRFRTALARWLCPDVFWEARRYHRMKSEARDAFWWLGEFPAASAALRWLLDNDHNRNREIAEPARGPWRSQVGDFRKQLRRGEHELEYPRWSALHSSELPDNQRAATGSHPSDDGWIEWHGKAECPVPTAEHIDVEFLDGSVHRNLRPTEIHWCAWQGHAFVRAYRIVQPAPAPSSASTEPDAYPAPNDALKAVYASGLKLRAEGIPVDAEPSLRVREGGYYRRGDGIVIGPLKAWPGQEFFWSCLHISWMADGRYSVHPSPYDLREEVYVSDTSPVSDEALRAAVDAETEAIIQAIAKLPAAGRDPDDEWWDGYMGGRDDALTVIRDRARLRASSNEKESVRERLIRTIQPHLSSTDAADVILADKDLCRALADQGGAR